MTASEAATRVRIAKKDFVAELEFAEHQSLDFAATMAHIQSSGSVTERELATPVAYGGFAHPYGHGPFGMAGPRGPIPAGGDAGIINVQTGQFIAGWEQHPGYFSGGTMTNSLVNNTEHAKDIEDTPDRLQILRPFIAELAEHVLPRRVKNLQDAFRRINQS